MTNKVISLLLIATLVISISVVLSGTFQPRSEVVVESEQNVEIRDGVQYVTIVARGGYSPRVSHAQAGIPTRLVMRTQGTYDCSAALVIRSIGYQKVLQPNGEEVIDLGTQSAGTLQGICSMGMYSFTVQFK